MRVRQAIAAGVMPQDEHEPVEAEVGDRAPGVVGEVAKSPMHFGGRSDLDETFLNAWTHTSTRSSKDYRSDATTSPSEAAPGEAGPTDEPLIGRLICGYTERLLARSAVDDRRYTGADMTPFVRLPAARQEALADPRMSSG